MYSSDKLKTGESELQRGRENLHGKVILLTGASSGIGKATAIRLSEMGASLVIVCRNENRGKEALEEITGSSGNDSVELITGNLELQQEVRKVADEFLSAHSRLDVLINNAGTNVPKYEETRDGVEKTMAVNYFAPFLLTNLLLEVMEKSAPSRIVNVSSVGHFGANLDLENLARDKRYGQFGLNAYRRSKLALTLFTYELSRRLNGKSVTANCLHPGTIRTNIWSHAGAATPLALLGSLFMKGADEGAKTSVYLASSPEVAKVTGKYFVDMKPRASSRESYDELAARKLWDMSAELTHL